MPLTTTNPNPRPPATPPATPLAVILAGGLGMRLRGAYSDGPKVMAPVGGRPFLEILLAWLRQHGFTRVVLCAGYRHEQIQERFGDGQSLHLQLQYSVEPEPLGTAGALQNAASLLGGEDRFLVLNGDSFFALDPHQLLRFHCDRDALLTIALARIASAERYGSVRLAADGHVLGFVEKGQSGAPGLINGGVYVFSREVLSRIPSGRAVSLEQEIFPALVGDAFYGLPCDGYFVDIGVPEDYRRVQQDFSQGLLPV